MSDANQFRHILVKGIRTRIIFSFVLAIFGGGLGILLASAIGGEAEKAIRFPLVVLFSVAFMALYEGWRKQEIAVPSLWLSVILSSIFAAGLVIPVQLLLNSSHPAMSKDFVRAAVFGLYGMFAMLGLCLPEFKSRSTTAMFKVVVMMVLSGLLYFIVAKVFVHVQLDPALAILGPGLACCLAVAHVLVPTYFEDVYLYIIGATNEKSMVKFNNSDTGYWTMAGEQNQLTIVDGTVVAFNDPTCIWIPEKLVPRLAEIKRSGGELRIGLHPDNTAPFQQGRVMVNQQILRPGQTQVLNNDDTVTAGSVTIKLETSGKKKAPKAMSLLLPAIFITATMLGMPGEARAQRGFKGNFQWMQCPAPEDETKNVQKVVKFTISMNKKSAKRFLQRYKDISKFTVEEKNQGEPKSLRWIHSLRGTAKKAGFTLDSKTLSGGSVTFSTESRVLMAIDISGSMAKSPEGRTAQEGGARWNVIWTALEKLLTAEESRDMDAAILPFDCMYASARQVASNLIFEPASSALRTFSFSRSLRNFKQQHLPMTLFGISFPRWKHTRDRHTALFSSAKSMLEGLTDYVKMNKSSKPTAFYLLTDGVDEEKLCTAGSRRIPRGSRHVDFSGTKGAIDAACKAGITVRFIVGIGSVEAGSIVTALKSNYSAMKCGSGHCPQLCWSNDPNAGEQLKSAVSKGFTAPEGKLSFYLKLNTQAELSKGTKLVLKDGSGKSISRVVTVSSAPGSVMGGSAREIADRAVINALCKDKAEPEAPPRQRMLFLFVPIIFGLASAGMVFRAVSMQKKRGKIG